MSAKKNLSIICPFKLQSIYGSLFELQQKLGLSDEYLLTTIRDPTQDTLNSDALRKLLESSKATRNRLITWYLRQTIVELNVTISLLTAKMKFIEYKLGLCDGLDLHQACSLSLVNFCGILSDMTILSAAPEDRKPLHKVSREAGVPIWLSHYRNQICHNPSESPCISILVPLVARSLVYMRDSFWCKLLERESFNAQRCRKLICHIANYKSVVSTNRRMKLRNGLKLSRKELKLAEEDLEKSTKACLYLRKSLRNNTTQALTVLVDFIVKDRSVDGFPKYALLLEQVIQSKCFERLVLKLLLVAEQKPDDEWVASWLAHLINIISNRRPKKLESALSSVGLKCTKKIVALTEFSPLKCCHLAYRLANLEHPLTRKLIIRMRHRLSLILGSKKTLLLIRLTKSNPINTRSS